MGNYVWASISSTAAILFFLTPLIIYLASNFLIFITIVLWNIVRMLCEILYYKYSIRSNRNKHYIRLILVFILSFALGFLLVLTLVFRIISGLILTANGLILNTSFIEEAHWAHLVVSMHSLGSSFFMLFIMLHMFRAI